MRPMPNSVRHPPNSNSPRGTNVNSPKAQYWRPAHRGPKLSDASGRLLCNSKRGPGFSRRGKLGGPFCGLLCTRKRGAVLVWLAFLFWSGRALLAGGRRPRPTTDGLDDHRLFARRLCAKTPRILRSATVGSVRRGGPWGFGPAFCCPICRFSSGTWRSEHFLIRVVFVVFAFVGGGVPLVGRSSVSEKCVCLANSWPFVGCRVCGLGSSSISPCVSRARRPKFPGLRASAKTHFLDFVVTHPPTPRERGEIPSGRKGSKDAFSKRVAGFQRAARARPRTPVCQRKTTKHSAEAERSRRIKGCFCGSFQSGRVFGRL